MDGLSVYPWNILPFTPPHPCAFDSYRGTIGFDIFPFAVTTRISASSEVFLKVYEEYGEVNTDVPEDVQRRENPD